MRLRIKASDVVHVLLLAVSVAATSYIAYRIVGFLGVGVLGLIIGVGAQTVGIEQGGPIGHDQAAGVYAQHMAAVDRMSAAERAERRAAIKTVAFPLLVAKVVSGALIVIGFGLFFVFQLSE
jgi:hypothetical protein